jgi:hypothetical protein
MEMQNPRQLASRLAALLTLSQQRERFGAQDLIGGLNFSLKDSRVDEEVVRAGKSNSANRPSYD